MQKKDNSKPSMAKNERKRGRPTGKNRVPLSLEERRSRNAQYERERRTETAEAMVQLAEAACCDPQITNPELLATVINRLHQRDNSKSIDDLKQINEDLELQIADLLCRLESDSNFEEKHLNVKSEEQTTSNSDGRSTSYSDGRNTSNSDGRSTSYSDGRNTSNSDGRSTSYSDGRNTSNSDGRSTSYSDGRNTSHSDEKTTLHADFNSDSRSNKTLRPTKYRKTSKRSTVHDNARLSSSSRHPASSTDSQDSDWSNHHLGKTLPTLPLQFQPTTINEFNLDTSLKDTVSVSSECKNAISNHSQLIFKDDFYSESFAFSVNSSQQDMKVEIQLLPELSQIKTESIEEQSKISFMDPFTDGEKAMLEKLGWKDFINFQGSYSENPANLRWPVDYSGYW